MAIHQRVWLWIGDFWQSVFADPSDISEQMFRYGFGAILLLAGVLRFWNLDGVSLWTDEAITHYQAQLSFSEIMFGGIDYHPPLSMVLQKIWASVFPDPAQARFPAAIFGIATLAVLMGLLRDFASRRAALISGLLLALTTGHVYFSQEARMYSLLVLGLAVASWGVLGFSLRGQHRLRLYAGLFVLGGLVQIGSHALGLVMMAIVGTLGLVVIYFSEDRSRTLKTYLLANIMLLVIGAAWIWQIVAMSGDHPGLEVKPVTLLIWHLLNVEGFPGLPFGAKLFELILFAVAFLAIPLMWLARKRDIAVLLIGLLIILPVSIAILHLKQPFLANRVVVPCVLGICMAFGIGASQIRSGVLRLSAIVLVCGAALLSTIYELTHHEKWEDYRGAFAIADEAGFGASPVLTCRHYSGFAVLAERSTADVYFYKSGQLLQQSKPGYMRIAAYPLPQIGDTPVEEIDDHLGGGFLLPGGLRQLLEVEDKIVFLRPFCRDGDDDIIKAALEQANYQEVSHTYLGPKYDRGMLLVSPMSRVTLYEKK